MQTCKIDLVQDSVLEKAYLISLNTSDTVVEIGDFFTFGRNPSNHMVLGDPFVSQRHARIEKRGSQFVLKDLRSSNGTLLNETPVIEATLSVNDRIRIGETQFIFASHKKDETELPTSKNTEWQRQIDKIPAFSSTEHTVLIIGPSGSGKEVIASLIHKLSPRRHGPFVAINCSALSEQLIESELFGHVKGSFTGAANDRKGAFEEARGGTLFLDEIGDLPINLQPKLLRALENQEIRPVGSDKTIRTHVRVLAATHKNLYEKILKQEFREDLYHRLNVCRISPPSLIDRIEDFEAILYSMARESRVRFSFAAMEKLKDHSWPGNIRELKNVVARAAAYFPGEQIEVDHLSQLVDRPPKANEALLESLPPIKELERELIIKNLEKHNGNQRRAAEDLKMPKSTLHDKVKTYGINPFAFKKRSRV
ncbi:MAG: sigma 54-interacting transcriptional regulator [Bdellovibrionales bacterium]|nr:sigma 54-interacting transcriptional regulator [Bdellovibrionales bacterium]